MQAVDYTVSLLKSPAFPLMERLQYLKAIFVPTIDKIGIHLWETSCISNELGFIISNINDSLTTTIIVSSSGKHVFTSGKSSLYNQKYKFLLMRRLVSLTGKPICNSMNYVSSTEILLFCILKSTNISTNSK